MNSYSLLGHIIFSNTAHDLATWISNKEASWHNVYGFGYIQESRMKETERAGISGGGGWGVVSTIRKNAMRKCTMRYAMVPVSYSHAPWTVQGFMCDQHTNPALCLSASFYTERQNGLRWAFQSGNSLKMILCHLQELITEGTFFQGSVPIVCFFCEVGTSLWHFCYFCTECLLIKCCDDLSWSGL